MHDEILYPVCPHRNVVSAYERFLGPDSGGLDRFFDTVVEQVRFYARVERNPFAPLASVSRASVLLTELLTAVLQDCYAALADCAASGFAASRRVAIEWWAKADFISSTILWTAFGRGMSAQALR